MAKPVVIDDGGSVRIREMDDGQIMDGLIGSPGANPTFSSASNQQFFGAGSAHNRCLLTVTSLAEDGTVTMLPLDAATGKIGQALAATDRIVITTTDAAPQTVTITFVNGLLHVVLSASATASELLRKSRRRYTMAKVDAIQNVSVNGTAIFDAGTATPAITTVHFTDQVPHIAALKHKATL